MSAAAAAAAAHASAAQAGAGREGAGGTAQNTYTYPTPTSLTQRSLTGRLVGKCDGFSEEVDLHSSVSPVVSPSVVHDPGHPSNQRQ